MQHTDPAAPAILEADWGRLLVDGQPAAFKDAKLFPGGARAWDWRETGTRHEPGVQPEDVVELLEYGVTAVVIGTGFEGRLKIKPETLLLLKTRGITAYIDQTEQAVPLYNQLRNEMAIGALIHSTC